MTKEQISDAVGSIRPSYLAEAAAYQGPSRHRPARFLWPVAAAVACLALVGVLQMRHSAPERFGSVTEPAVTNPLREAVPTAAPQEPTQPSAAGETVNLYRNLPAGIDEGFTEQLCSALEQAGWSETTCTLWSGDSFFLHGENAGSGSSPDAGTCRALAAQFLEDSGLKALLDSHGADYELEAVTDGDLTVTFCRLLEEGQQTGAYIRMIFAGDHAVGEVQALLYFSECTDRLALLPMETALENAFRLEEGRAIAVNTGDYTLANQELVYRNGLPYYRFDGFGIHTRDAIEGYALAVNLETSEHSQQLQEQYRQFAAFPGDE